MADEADKPVRTYELTLDHGGAMRIDIPENWKVTFGPIVGAGGPKSGGSSQCAFRAWETETKQRFLMVGVAGFRDVSIPVLRRVVRRYGTEDWFVDDGSWEGKKAEQVQHDWRPIDDAEVLDYDPATKPRNDPADIERGAALTKTPPRAFKTAGGF